MTYRFSRVPLAILFASLGLFVSASGLVFLHQLSQTYRIADIAYIESEQTFYDWLAAAIKRHDREPGRLVDLIAERLLIMPVSMRRRAVNSMMIDYFWDELAPPGTDRKPVFALMTRATKEALKTSPLTGDLWLFAAWLRTKIGGFDDTAAEYFLASQRFTPREDILILLRLDFIRDLESPLPEDLKTAVINDLRVAKTFDADQAKDYQEQLKVNPDL